VQVTAITHESSNLLDSFDYPGKHVGLFCGRPGLTEVVWIPFSAP
jgi:hypothetical protein